MILNSIFFEQSSFFRLISRKIKESFKHNLFGSRFVRFLNRNIYHILFHDLKVFINKTENFCSLSKVEVSFTFL